MKVFLEGNRGRVGSVVEADLMARGHEVTGYDRLDGYDILDVLALETAVQESVRYLEEVGGVIEQVASFSEESASASEETAASIQEQTAATEEVAVASTKVQEEVAKVIELAKKIVTEVETFKNMWQ